MSVHRGAQGTQYRWTDLKFPLTRDKQGQSSLPDYDFTRMGLLFPQNDPTEIVYFTTQFPHWGRNMTLSPHVHFVQEVAQQPVWELQYRIVENGDNDSFKAFTPLTASTFAFTWVSGDLLQIASFPDIDISGLTSISWMMDIQLWRDDNVVTGDVLGKQFDIHYQLDDWGSRQPFIK